VIGDAAPDAVFVAPPSVEVQVTTLLVIASPFADVVNATIAELEPRVTPVIVGVEGAVAATNEFESCDAELLPEMFVATTAHEYVFAFVSAETVIGDEPPDADFCVPPSLDVHVTVNKVIGLPPVAFGVNATVAELEPRVTAPMLGAVGTVPAVNDVDAADEPLVPRPFVAVTAHV
jgi:hypothetical protein